MIEIVDAEPLHAVSPAYLGLGMQRPVEFATWIALCQHARVRTYVELGFMSGQTAKIAATEIPGVHLAAVDLSPWGGSKAPREIEVLPWGERTGLFWGNSHVGQTRTQVLRWLGVETVDAVFVDADHLAAEADYDLWWPVTRRLMGFHDAQNPETPAVRLFLERLSDRHPMLWVTSTGDPGPCRAKGPMGIAVIQR